MSHRSVMNSRRFTGFPSSGLMSALPQSGHERVASICPLSAKRDLQCFIGALGGNASGICQFSARTEVSLWLAGTHDVVPVAEHEHLRRTPNDAFQVHHGPHP